MEMQHFCNVHYAEAFQPVAELSMLAQQVYEVIRLEPNYTGELRKKAIEQFKCSKSQFETALKHLQISLNIVRSNDLQHANDFWLPMRRSSFGTRASPRVTKAPSRFSPSPK